MKIDNYINKKPFVWFLPLLFVLMGYLPAYSQTSTYGDFPYYQSFSSTSRPTEISIPAVTYGSNSAIFTKTGVLLTQNSQQQFGAIFVNNRRFSSRQGIQVEFEYMMYGGSGGDGITCFFFDADEPSPAIGANGAGLGYAYRRTITGFKSRRTPGLKNAYLGIALDGFGNFKMRRFQGDARVNGLRTHPFGTDDDAYRNHVTLRGPQGGSLDPAAGLIEGYTGYPVLITQPVGSSSYKSAHILNNSSGAHVIADLYSGPVFQLRSETSFEVDEVSNPAYRKAMIEIYPHPSNGVYVTIKIQHGTTVTTVIKDYNYQTNLKYTENANGIGGDEVSGAEANREAPDRVESLNVSPPSSLCIGFAASTGGYTDILAIRELKISLPRSAIAIDDNGKTPKNRPLNLNVLDNDIGYTGIISKDQEGSSDYLDPNSFTFCDKDGQKVGTTNATGVEHTTTMGTWTFNFQTKKLNFMPAPDVVGEATVYYSVKAGKNDEAPYNDEAYRSIPSLVTVEVEDISIEAIISNRMITSGHKDQK